MIQALYLAFSAKGISDGKQHYLLSDKDGKGIFIQKVASNGDQKPVYVIGMDYKQFENYVYIKELLGNKKLKNAAYIQFLGGYPGLLKIVDKKQVLIASGIPRTNKDQTNNRLTNPALKQSSYLLQS